ncbi:MAG: M67 family metallopeptidase [Pseudomonadota bacterium]
MKMPEEIELPRPLSNQLLHLAQQSSVEEICGLVGARDGVPTTCYPVRNVARSPKHHFQMDPREQIGAMKAMRAQNEQLFGIYHSHPDSSARPSREDLEQAAYPEALYLIISLNTKGVLEMRGFRLTENKEVQDVTLLLKHD